MKAPTVGRHLWASVLGIVLSFLGAALHAQSPASYARADIEYGSRIYVAQCVACHGPDGNLVAAVDLGAGRFQRVSSDDDLRTIVTTGIAGTAMPPFRFDTAELAGIVAYVRNMRDFTRGAVTLGDAERGRAVFEGSGKCLSCHRVNGIGSRVAPELSDIAIARTADALQQSLVDPTGSMRPSNRTVRAVRRDGRVITGRRLNEDTYTVQLIDSEERLVSLAKADLREYTVITTSPMPSYKDALNSAELADVVAYLLSLKGAR